MTATAPGKLRRDARPPIEMDAAPAPGVVASTRLRPTARPRPWVRPLLIDGPAMGHEPAEAAVRRFWTALLGPGAVADLLRITAAAAQGRRIRQPIHLAQLASEGLVERHRDLVLVRPLVPYLDLGQQQRLRPSLRGEYRRLIEK